MQEIQELYIEPDKISFVFNLISTTEHEGTTLHNLTKYIIGGVTLVLN